MQVVESVSDFVPLPMQSRVEASSFLATMEDLVRAQAARLQQESDPASQLATGVGCRRNPTPKGPMWGFDYSYLEDRLAKSGLPTPELLDYQGLWGAGPEYAYEALNLVDGQRNAAEIRDTLTAIYGPIPAELVVDYLETLAEIGILDCRD